LPCLTYLVEQCGQEISVEDKRKALSWANDQNHQACAQLLKEHLKPAPSSMNPLSFIFTSMKESSNKRKREQENENEVPPNKKIKDEKTNKNETGEEENNDEDNKNPQNGWTCSVM